jgi:hypothetical protein
MDLDEVRAAFARAGAFGEKIQRFRAERIAKLLAGEGPVTLDGNAIVVLHMIPFSAFDLGRPFVHFSGEEGRRWVYQPLYAQGWDFRYNADGLLSVFPHGRELSTSYLQVFRKGMLEFADTGLLLAPERQIPASEFERSVHNAIQRGLKLLADDGATFPVSILLSLLGVRGYSMAWQPMLPLREPTTIEREVVTAPDILVENPTPDLPTALRPVFDVVWNAAGLAGSHHYDREGNWRYRE